jgi:hypothetical protein
MKMTAVSSSNLASVGYDSATRTLRVEFRSGAVYEYYDVPEAEYQGLMDASSKGHYLHQNIKDRYRYTKIG